MGDGFMNISLLEEAFLVAAIPVVLCESKDIQMANGCRSQRSLGSSFY